jgi:prepilin-type N-terminal cleavage/methylation domain-containing protein
MKINGKAENGFTLLELLVVLSTIAALAALLLTGLKGAQNKAKQTICLNNLRQISLALRQYVDDSLDQTPRIRGPVREAFLTIYGYKKLIGNYVGTGGQSSLQEKVFACPADTFYYGASNGFKVLISKSLHDQSATDYDSYGFNAGNLDTNLSRYGIDSTRLGIGGLRLSSIKHPSETILILEVPAAAPYSWHRPKLPLSLPSYHRDERFHDAMNMIGFVDGHVSYIKIYWSDTRTNGRSLYACEENPPPGYGYQWGGD